MAEGKFSFHITVKSQSFSWPVSLGYAFHKCFPSGTLFFPFPPCLLLPYLAIAFLFDFLEAPSLADNVFPLLGETGSLDETEHSGEIFFLGTHRPLLWRRFWAYFKMIILSLPAKAMRGSASDFHCENLVGFLELKPTTFGDLLTLQPS